MVSPVVVAVVSDCSDGTRTSFDLRSMPAAPPGALLTLLLLLLSPNAATAEEEVTGRGGGVGRHCKAAASSCWASPPSEGSTSQLLSTPRRHAAEASPPDLLLLLEPLNFWWSGFLVLDGSAEVADVAVASALIVLGVVASGDDAIMVTLLGTRRIIFIYFVFIVVLWKIQFAIADNVLRAPAGQKVLVGECNVSE